MDAERLILLSFLLSFISSINIWFALVNKYVILEWHILENSAPQVLAPLVLSDLMQIDIKSGVIKETG